MTYRLTAPPAVEPVSVTELKLQARIDAATEDALLAVYLGAARELAEQRTERVIIAQTRTLTLDDDQVLALEDDVELRWGPVQSVLSVTYKDSAGTSTSWASTNYLLYVGSDVAPGELMLKTPATWPAVGDYEDALTVTYAAGYAAPFTVAAATNRVSVEGFGALSVNDPVRLMNLDGALPGGLSAGKFYFIKSIVSSSGTSCVYTLSETTGGTETDITSAGTGTHFLGEIPQGYRAWILLAATWMYENRSTDLPRDFADGLLDRYRSTRF